VTDHLPGDVTRLFEALASDDRAVVPEVLPLLYEELRGLAALYLRRERAHHTLQPTALVHEAYLRLMTQERVAWKNRAHVVGIAGRLMRRVLVDHARARHAAKRGGHETRVALEDVDAADKMPDVEILDLDRALHKLAAFDARQSQIVELRYFGGLSVEEVAEVLSLSPATVKREWQMARAWLLRALQTGR
jgi:RNA polymerase sigma factor (TIGR02999 family)